MKKSYVIREFGKGVKQINICTIFDSARFLVRKIRKLEETMKAYD